VLMMSLCGSWAGAKTGINSAIAIIRTLMT
jgi:hypothetical protein